MSELLRNYFTGVEKFKAEILQLPSNLEESNPSIDFSSDLNKHQSIMIDVHGLTETLSDHFFLFAEDVENNVIRELNQQLKLLTAKLGLISIAADEGSLEKVKELIPPSCADVVREVRADAVVARPPLINLDSLADGNHSFSFKTKNNQKFREIKINIETLPSQLRNPEQEK